MDHESERDIWLISGTSLVLFLSKPTRASHVEYVMFMLKYPAMTD